MESSLGKNYFYDLDILDITNAATFIFNTLIFRILIPSPLKWKINF